MQSDDHATEPQAQAQAQALAPGYYWVHVNEWVICRWDGEWWDSDSDYAWRMSELGNDTIGPKLEPPS